MDVPLNERPPTIGQTMVRQRPMTSGPIASGSLASGSLRPTTSYERPRTASVVVQRQTQSSSQSSGPMAQVQVGSHIQNVINNPNATRYQQPGMGGVLNQFGSGLCGMCTSVGGCFNGIAGSVFGNFSNITSGISSYLPNFSMIQFRLLNLLSPSYSSDATNPFEKYNDLLILKSNTSTVQYYSRDSFENLKIKVTIKRTNMVIGKKSFKERKEQRDSAAEPYDDDEEETEYKTFVTVLQWQQKVFGPREIVLYNKTQTPKTTLEGFYKEEVSHLVESLNTERPPIELFPYIQDDMENCVVEEMFGNSKKQPENEVKEAEQIEEEEEGQEKPKKQRKPRKKFGSEGFSDLLQHKLFTYVEIDDFETDNVHQSIACSSETPYPIFKNAKKPLSSKSQTMYIMTSVGDMQNGAWKGKEYPICIIQSLPDGSFLMKPGFSVKPLENQKEEPTSDFLKRYQNEIGDIDLLLKPKENRYIFRTDDGAVYEYTISLYNDYKKDTKVDEMRKKILKQLQERSLLMKRNLVGMEFNHPPKDKRIRVSISGNILSGRDFDSEKYYIRYYLDMPSNFVFEDPMSQKLITSTQMGTAVEITKEYESYYEANFSFPFNFNCLCSNITPMPKLFFQVTSKDFWDRYRVEGYGFIALPSTPGYHNYTVNTWKPTGSIRNNLRSSFVGGSTELRDLSYTAIPNGFEQHFLNKFGFATDPSGSISVCLNVIYHGDVN